MQYVTKQGLKDMLKILGIESGDTLIIHSDITSIGKTDHLSLRETLNMYYEAIMEVIGDEGTLCVPAFFYEYARNGIPFDISQSPISKEVGLFPKFIQSLPNSKRSCNPLTSVCAVGKNADYICEYVNRHAYGENSAFDRLYKINAKLISIGHNLAFTICHLCEFQVGVPYLYNKIYNVPILDNGKIIFEYSIGYVRYLEYDIKYSWQIDKSWSEQTWLKEKFVNRHKYINSEIYVVKVSDIFAYFKEQLYKNPYFFLTNKPNFIYGQIPNDGPVLKK